MEMVFIGVRGVLIAMDDEDALDLVRLQTTGEVVYHLLVVTVPGEAFYLGYLRLDTTVETEDGNPLESRFLNTCAEGGGFAVTDDEEGATRVGDVIRHVVLDTSGLQHTAGGDDDTGFVLMVQRLRFIDIRDVTQRIEAEGVGVKT